MTGWRGFRYVHASGVTTSPSSPNGPNGERHPKVGVVCCCVACNPARPLFGGDAA